MDVGGFDWDEGNWPKCAKHGLRKAEIEFALNHGPLVLPDRTIGPETRFNTIGRSAAGRHLFVVFAIREVGGERLIRPISARYMHGKEVDHYERRNKA